MGWSSTGVPLYFFLPCSPSSPPVIALDFIRDFTYSVCYTGYSTVKTKDRGITETAPQLVVKGVG